METSVILKGNISAWFAHCILTKKAFCWNELKLNCYCDLAITEGKHRCLTHSALNHETILAAW